MYVHRETLNVGQRLANELEFDREGAGEPVQVGFTPRVDGEVGTGKRPVMPVTFTMSAGWVSMRRARVRWVVNRT